MDQAEMRQANTAQILGVLYRDSPVTMAALQQESGLSRRTIDLILEELIATGWIAEAPTPDVRRVGRPARGFTFRYAAAHFVALQLWPGMIHATVADLSATVLAEIAVTLPVKSSRKRRLARLDDCVTKVLDQAGVERSSVVAVTVSSPGIVQDDGVVDLPMTIPDWTGFSLSQAVGEMFDCAVRVENDAKLAALGEKWSRNDSVNDYAYILADSQWLGVGIVIRGELYRGTNGAAGEVGWIPALGFQELDLADTMLMDLEHAKGTEHASSQARLAAARAGDPAGLRDVEQLARALAPGITAIAWLLAPEEIILGGTLGSIQDLIIPALESVLAENDKPIITRLSGSQSGERSLLTGCLRMCIESFGDGLLAPALAPRRRPTPRYWPLLSPTDTAAGSL